MNVIHSEKPEVISLGDGWNSFGSINYFGDGDIIRFKFYVTDPNNRCHVFIPEDF
jgi:hypothetical protein